MQLRDWQHQLRERFYRALAAQNKVAVLEGVETRIAQIARSVEQRFERGDASKLDVLRIQKQRLLMATRHADSKASLVAVQGQLFALLQKSSQALTGSLVPSANNINAVPAQYNPESHPQIVSLLALIRSAEMSAKAAGREHWPELNLGVGHKEVKEPALEADGSSFSVGLTLPFFDRGHGEQLKAQAQVVDFQARKSLLISHLGAEYQSNLQALKAYAVSVATLVGPQSNTESSLSALTEARYRAGESTVIELLDSYQTDIAVRLQSIDSALQARLAYIQLQHLLGI